MHSLETKIYISILCTSLSLETMHLEIHIIMKFNNAYYTVHLETRSLDCKVVHRLEMHIQCISKMHSLNIQIYSYQDYAPLET